MSASPKETLRLKLSESQNIGIDPKDVAQGTDMQAAAMLVTLSYGPKIDALIEGQSDVQSILSAQNSVLADHTSKLAAGALKMDKIDATTTETNGKVKVLRSEMDVSKEDIATIMAERKVRIVNEETEKLRASVTKGYALIPVPTSTQVLWAIGGLITTATAIFQLWPAILWAWSKI